MLYTSQVLKKGDPIPEIKEECCHNRGNIEEVLQWICRNYNDNKSSIDAQNRKANGYDIENFSNCLSACKSNTVHLRTNLCYTWYFVHNKGESDVCENRDILYCYTGNLFNCGNITF